MNYFPFKGAKVIGSAKGSRINIVHDGLEITMRSDDGFLPGDMSAKIYGYVDIERKTQNRKSVQASSAGSEERFLAHDLLR
jgi:hypothetical protein